MTGEPTEVLGPTRIVLGDANVLYPRVLRDYLVYAADEGAISIKWSRAILNEAVKHLRANIATFDAEQADRLIRLLNEAYPDAEIEPTASADRKVSDLDLPDEDDRHVLAAAVAAHADILCTDNLKDFPPAAMAAVGIELMSADALLTRLVRTLSVEDARGTPKIGSEPGGSDRQVDDRGTAPSQRDGGC